MKLDRKQAKRCGIFLFFDKDGIADEYVIEMLRDLQKNVEFLLVVCNGFVEHESRRKLRSVSSEVIARANVGFDVAGYREGLFYMGWRSLQEYDEIVLMNYTFFAPIFPFQEMFDEMAQRDVSFWGVTKHHKVDSDPFDAIPYGYLPEHLQSHFLVVRRDLFMSYQYRDFMCNKKNPTSYLESICGYEAIFTKYFEDLGFSWDVYVDTDEYEGYAYNPVMFYTTEVLKEKHCPIIKRRSFFTDYSDYLLNSCGETSWEMYQYLKEQGGYDLNLIWDNILRLENLTAIHQVLHLNYVLESYATAFAWEKQNIALILWVEDTKRIGWYEKYLRALPEALKVYLYGEAEDCEKVRALCSRTETVTVCGKNPAGQAELFAMAAEDLQEKSVSYVGIARIRNVEDQKPYSNTVSWQYGDWENLFGNEYIIGNLLDSFRENPRMGLCIPPVPRYGRLFEEMGDGWKGHFQDVKMFLETRGIHVNLNPRQRPLTPIGGSFWLRGDCLAAVAGLVQQASDDVALLALPFVVQHLKAYTGVAYSDRYASVEITNQDYMFRENNKTVFRKYGPECHKVVMERIRTGDLSHTEGA